VEAGIAESSHRRFITICLSRGASSLQDDIRIKLGMHRRKSTEILQDMMMTVGTNESKYFATEIAKMAIEHGRCLDWQLLVCFLRRHRAAQKASWAAKFRCVTVLV
jgi:hypothetical protein